MPNCIVAILITAILAAGLIPARADPLADGFTAWRDGDYAVAYRQWRPLAEEGNMDAQGALGFMFYNGQGVPQDYRQAFAWYRRSAEQGNALAQNNLGLMYADGQGVPRDPVRAHMWFNVAATTATGPARQSALDNRDRYAREMSAQQIDQAQAMAWRCTQSKFKECE